MARLQNEVGTTYFFSSHDFFSRQCSEIFPEMFEPLFCGSEKSRKIPAKCPSQKSTKNTDEVLQDHQENYLLLKKLWEKKIRSSKEDGPGLPNIPQNSAEPLGLCKKVLQNVSHFKKLGEERFCRTPNIRRTLGAKPSFSGLANASLEFGKPRLVSAAPKAKTSLRLGIWNFAAICDFQGCANHEVQTVNWNTGSSRFSPSLIRDLCAIFASNSRFIIS